MNDSLFELISTRRTIRRFRNDIDIDNSLLKNIVKVGSLAPCRMNNQAWEFIIIKGDNTKNEIFKNIHWGIKNPVNKGFSDPFYAPNSYIAVIIDTKLKEKGYEYEIGASIENMMIYAWGLGIGSVWLHSINRTQIRKTLKIPEDKRLVCLIGLGYPAHSSSVVPMKNNDCNYYTDEELNLYVPKRSLEDVVYWNYYNCQMDDAFHKEITEENITSKLKTLSIGALSDAMDQLGFNGGCIGLHARSLNKELVGRAFTVKFSEVKQGEFSPAADYIDDVPKNSVIVIDNNGRDFCTVWGNILSCMAKRKGIAGTIIDGACRDIDILSKMDYPVFSKYIFMKTGRNRVRLEAVQKQVNICGVKVNPNDYIKASASGVLVIPNEYVLDVIEKAEQIEENEKNILISISQGMPLKEARKKYHYNLKCKNVKNGL